MRQPGICTFPMPTLHIKFRVTSPGGVILHEHEEEGHSWTRWAWNIFNAQMMDAGQGGNPALGRGSLSARGFADNSIYSVATSAYSRPTALAGYGFFNNAEDSSYGIIVGRSDLPFYTDDYALYDQITHGATAGLFNYVAQAAPVTVFDDVNNKWSTTHTRIFNNNSGAAITVKEIGLVSSNPGSHNGLMARDVLTAPVIVVNGAQLTVWYVITTGSFDVCDAAAMPSFPALGSAGSGGYYMGQCGSWTQPYSAYMLICSPITGEAYGLPWKTTQTDPPGAESDWGYGANNMAGLYALGAASPMAAFCASLNAALLGGFGDWYIPAWYEATPLCANQALLPVGHKFTNNWYWSSTRWDTTTAYVKNFVTSQDSGGGKDSTDRHVRLVRRIHIKDWVAGDPAPWNGNAVTVGVEVPTIPAVSIIAAV